MSSVERLLARSVLPAAVVFLTSAALVGCGGGDDRVLVAPPPSETASGLTGPTGALQTSEEVARSLANALGNAMAHARLGVASRGMGSFAPAIDHGMADTFDCPGGGTASFEPGDVDSGAYLYSACVIDGVSYTGRGPVTLTLNNGELEHYAIEQSAITAVMDGIAYPLDAQVDCFAPGEGHGGGRESPQHIVGPLLCVGQHGGIAYGADFELHDGVISGSMQWPSGSDRWNAYAWDVGTDSGSVYIDAANGTAAIRRFGGVGHKVAISATGRTEVFEVGP